MNELEAHILRNKFSAKKIFSRIPGWISYGHGLKALQGSELKVLLYICSKADNTTHIAITTREIISLGTGVSLGSISGIIKSLTMQGCIRVEKEGRNNTYYVQFDPPDCWPLGGAANILRIRAASGRREIFNKNRLPVNDKSPSALPYDKLGSSCLNNILNAEEECLGW